MSRSDRGKDSGILIAGIFTFLLIFSMIGYYLGIEQGLELEHEKRAQHEQADAAEHISSYCLHAGVIISKCVQDEIKAYTATHDGSEDLSAQKQMAFWAKWLLILTAFATGFSMLTVVYVAKTLSATRDTIEVTRKIGEAEVRAYPSVKSVTFQWKDERPSCIIKLSNAGNSPALKFNCAGEYHLNFLGDPNEKNDRFAESLSVGINSVAQIALNPGDAKIESDGSRTSDTQREVCVGKMSDTLNNKKGHWTMTLRFQWTDVFGNKFGFYANARENGRITNGQRNSGDWQSTLEITYQSESRERKES